MNKEIKVIIEKDGKVTFEVQGVRGSQCLNLTESLEQGIGDVIERRKKGEFYQFSSINLEQNIDRRNIPD
ncbi:MAG: DUF2997 domain-containing protein [Deltaproteobacteria bacterium]|nr:DUF2997 domain-containing protein [Deltaproteobacteria bacterium]